MIDDCRLMIGCPGETHFVSKGGDFTGQRSLNNMRNLRMKLG